MDPLYDPKEPAGTTPAFQEKAKRVYEDAKDSAARAYESARGRTRESFASARAQASQTMEEARQRLREGAQTAVTSQKDRAVGSLRRISRAVEETADRLNEDGDPTLAEYTRAVSSRIEKAAGFLEHREPAELLADAEGIIRRQAALFIGGMFVAGLIVARVMRSSRDVEQAGATGTELSGTSGNEPNMLPKPSPGQASAMESTYIPPVSGSRFNAFGPDPDEI